MTSSFVPIKAKATNRLGEVVAPHGDALHENKCCRQRKSMTSHVDMLDGCMDSTMTQR